MVAASRPLGGEIIVVLGKLLVARTGELKLGLALGNVGVVIPVELVFWLNTGSALIFVGRYCGANCLISAKTSVPL